MNLKLLIHGMHCGSCVRTLQERLLEHPAIRQAEVTLDPPMASLVTAQELSVTELNAWLNPLGRYRVEAAMDTAQALATSSASTEKSFRTYRPLVILLVYLLLVIGAQSVATGKLDAMEAMRWFMGGFFVAFSFFKMLDLKGFAQAYRSYDLLARAWPGYGYVYPFIELALGLAYLADWQPSLVNLITASVMAVSLIGVVQAVLSRRSIRCACLGTVFQLPMSTVTIIEDGLMLGMALLALLAKH